MIRVFEVNASTGGFHPTGRQILMAADSPLFTHFGDLGKQAISEGSLALEEALFQQVFIIVQQAQGGAVPMPIAVRQHLFQGDPRALHAKCEVTGCGQQRSDAVHNTVDFEDEDGNIDGAGNSPTDALLGPTYFEVQTCCDSDGTGFKQVAATTEAFAGFGGGEAGGAGVSGDYADPSSDATEDSVDAGYDSGDSDGPASNDSGSSGDE